MKKDPPPKSLTGLFAGLVASVGNAARRIPECPICGPLRIPSPFATANDGATIPVLCPHQMATLEKAEAIEARRMACAAKTAMYGAISPPKAVSVLFDDVDGRSCSAAGRLAALRILGDLDGAMSRGEGLYLHGNTGTGKSLVAGALAHHAEQRHYWTIYTSASEFLERCLGPLEQSTLWLRACKRADLLVLDDLGAEKASEFGMAKLFDLLNERYERQRATVVTSNRAPAALAQHYRGALLRLRSDDADIAPKRLLSRLMARCAVALHEGEDQRLARRILDPGGAAMNGGAPVSGDAR